MTERKLRVSNRLKRIGLAKLGGGELLRLCEEKIVLLNRLDINLRSVRGDLWLLILVTAMAIAIRIVMAFALEPREIGDPAEHDRLGWRLAQGLGYTGDNGEPTALFPIGYPLFLAGIYTLFGHSFTVACIANALLGGAVVLLTYILAREVLSSRLSLIAAILVAFIPSYIVTYTDLWSEMLHTVLVLIALTLTFHLVRNPNWKGSILLGILLGLGVHVRAILLLFPVAVALIMIFRGIGVRKSIGLASIAMVSLLLVILPWTVRNYVAMDAFILTNTGVGKIFYEGNGPDATGYWYSSFERKSYSSLDEMTVYREGIQMGLENIVNNPGQWIAILPIKFFHLWSHDNYYIAPGILRKVAQIYWMVFIAVAGLAITSRPLPYWFRGSAMIFTLTLVYWCLFHMGFLGQPRYHMQMVPIISIIVAHLFGTRDWTSWIPIYRPKNEKFV